MPFIDVAGSSDAGRNRRINDDAFVVANLGRAATLHSSSLALANGVKWFEAPQGKLIAVADGISSAGGAALASNVAIRELVNYFVGRLSWSPEMRDEDALTRAFEHALERCQDEINAQSESSGMKDVPVGTSLTAVYINWPHLFVASVGSTRAYLMRGAEIEQLTKDDTLAQQLRDRDLSTGGDLGPRAHKILTNVLAGGNDSLSVECHKRILERGDQVALCCDGVSGVIDKLQIAEALRKAPIAATASRSIVDMAMSERGEDNATIVVARFGMQPHKRKRAVELKARRELDGNLAKLALCCTSQRRRLRLLAARCANIGMDQEAVETLFDLASTYGEIAEEFGPEPIALSGAAGREPSRLGDTSIEAAVAAVLGSPQFSSTRRFQLRRSFAKLKTAG